MFYLVYKITNTVNNKIYIGSHRTLDINDNYMGSGKVIKQAIVKYGVESFNKEILYIFDNLVDMFNKERELVNEEFVSDPNTYNLLIGGNGGFSKASAKIGRGKTNKILWEKYGDDWRSIIAKKSAETTRSRLRDNRAINPTYCTFSTENAAKGSIAAQSCEAKAKRKETMKANGHSQGEKNSQFGSIWITNGTENKKIKKDDLIPDGWIKGRKTK